MKSTRGIFLAISVILFSCTDKMETQNRIYPIAKSVQKGKASLLPGDKLEINNLGFTDTGFMEEFTRQKFYTHCLHPEEGTTTSLNFILDNSIGEEIPGAYELSVSKDIINIRAADESGIFYGIQTLLQLIENTPENSKLPVCTIKDFPRFNWRGMHLDVSRHFFPVDFIKKYIDILAMHKLNVFHWHLVDDQGWRIEIKKYPELTEKGAWRIDRRDSPWSYELTFTNIDDPKAYGGYYTQEEIKEVIAYAAERYITIVPEIELPGHSQAALTVFPELSCSGKPWQKPDNVPFEFSDPYCAGKVETFEFLKNVLTEVMELFPSEYIHIGGDEAKKTPWENCPECRKRMKDEGLESTEELQAWFIEEIDKYLQENGRKTIGWNEIMEGGISREAAIMAWTGSDISLEAMEAGYRTVSAESSYYYFNRAQGNDNEIPSAILSLEHTYLHDPLPENTSAELAEKFLGMNACLWTENVQTPEKAMVQLLPRLTAFAETAWSLPEQKNFEDFSASMVSFMEYLDLEDIDYYIGLPTGLNNDLFYEDEYILEMENPLPGSEIRYSIDGTEPGPESLLYGSALSIDKTTSIKAAVFLPSGKKGNTRSVKITKTELQPATETGDMVNGCLLKTAEKLVSDLDEIAADTEYQERIVSNFSIPDDLAGKDGFILSFDSYILIESDGIYSFACESDDGSRIYIDGELLADNDGVHGPVKVTGRTGLMKGYHKIRVDFFEAAYGEMLNITIKKPGGTEEIISPEMLFIKEK